MGAVLKTPEYLVECSGLPVGFCAGACRLSKPPPGLPRIAAILNARDTPSRTLRKPHPIEGRKLTKYSLLNL